MKFIRELLSFFVVLLFLCLPIYATTITYEATNISGSQWECTYSVTNDTLGADIEEFTIYFDLGLYDNLVATDTPYDWDPLVINPDPNIPDDGYYDALAWSVGIAPGETLSGFTVMFDYLGPDAPGSQYFEVVDAWTWEVLDSGDTVHAAAEPVPEPATFFLIGTGLLGIIGIRRKK